MFDYKVVHGDCLDYIKTIPTETIQVIVTSPPYNIEKEYESKQPFDIYLNEQKNIIKEYYRILKPSGSVCYQTGNYVNNGTIFPLDYYFYPVFIENKFILRNRIIWHFEHGLHCKKRFSGRYEIINWFTKSDNYVFNLDPVRIPQKYPNKKHYKGLNKGKLSGNPKGKNPSDVWNIANIKHNHPEKTTHPCQFPIKLVKNLILSLSNEKDIILDPFLGSGTTIIACLETNRIGLGIEKKDNYIKIINDRIDKFINNLTLFR